MVNVKEFSANLAKFNPKLAALLDGAIARDEEIASGKTVLICENDEYGSHKPFASVEAFEAMCESEFGAVPRLYERGFAVYDNHNQLVLRRVYA